MRTKTFILASAIFLLSSAVVLAHADTSAEDSENRRSGPATTLGICSRIDALLESRTSRFSSKKGDLTLQRADQTAAFARASAALAENIAKHRDTWDANRSEQYEALRRRAATNAEQSAVEQFVETVDAAIAERRNATDAAIEEFHNAMRAVMSARRGAIDDAVSAYEAAVSEALQHAKDHCDAGERAASIKSDLTEALAQAKAAFEEARKNADTVSDAKREAVEAKRAAIGEAWEAFHETIQAAADLLKTSLGSQQP